MEGMPLTFSRELQISKEIGKGLEDSLKDVKKIDLAIAKSLNHSSSYFSKVPIVNKVVTKVRTIRPLDSLESELRNSLNNSLFSIVRLGKKAEKEKERIHELMEIYETAKNGQWEPVDFIDFIEQNIDLNYTVIVEGEEVDLKKLFSDVDSRLSPERRDEKREEYFEWFRNHINLSEQYLGSMHALCFVGSQWIEGMTRSYFDLTQIRGGMDEIRKTLENLGYGGNASLTSQRAIRSYGTAYVDGMRKLVKGYNEMCALRDNGSNEFQSSIRQLEAELKKEGSEKIEESHTRSRKLRYSKKTE